MQGFQVTFFTGESRHHGHTPMATWLMEVASSLGITGATLAMATEGRGRDGRLHSAHFLDLADQPIDVTLAVTAEQWDLLAAALVREQADVFYTKTPVEFGVLGGPTAHESQA